MKCRKERKATFFLATYAFCFFSFFLLCYLDLEIRPRISNGIKLQGISQAPLYTPHKGVQGLPKTFIFFFSIFPQSLFHITRYLSCRTLERSREVRGVTWEWQQMRRNEITRCLDIMSACCAFSAKLLWQASQCAIVAPSLSFCHPIPSFFLALSLSSSFENSPLPWGGHFYGVKSWSFGKRVCVVCHLANPI